MFQISIDDKVFKNYMKAFRAKIADLSPALRSYSEYHKKSTLDRTNSGLDFEGKSFKPLKPATLLRKKGRGILLETEEMIESLKYNVKKQSLVYGLYDKKYIFHHVGTNRLPQRRILGDSKEDRLELIKILRLYVKRSSAKRKR